MSVAVQFSELLDPTTAADTSHYSVTGATIASATVMADGRSVVLGVPGLSGPSFTLQVAGITDLGGNALNGSISGIVPDYQVIDVGTLNAPSRAYAFTPDSLNTVVDGGLIWDNQDAGNFIGQNFTGDFDVRVQVSRVAGGNHNSNMLLDARESTDPGARHIAVTVYPTQGSWVSFLRETADGPTSVFPGAWRKFWPAGTGFPNVWLRIRKAGNTFRTYGGTNGIDWTQVGDAYTLTTPFASTFVSMASAVTDAGQAPLQTEFSNFSASIIRPQLHISATPSSVVLSWPGVSTGFHLQKTDRLGADATWTNVTEPVDLVGNNYVVTLPPSSGAWFYRLVH